MTMRAGLSAGMAANCLGKYRLIAELGRGGMAEVFLAVAAGPGGFNKLLVLKRIRPMLAEDPDFLSMFLDEARLAARLNHPNIVQTNEVGQEANQYYIAMEYLEGQPLNRIRSRLDRHQRGLPLGMHLRIVCEVLSGLHYAHELTDYDGTPLGVVHRDASPHNTFVTYTGQVKLVDFGIAKAMNSTAETRAGMLKGKVPYMAPEQARADGVDRRADVFSAGVMMWEALAGQRLWKNKPDVSVLKWLVDPAPDPLPSPRSHNPDVPAILEAICMRALSPNRDLRQATALELQHELEHALASLPDRHNVRDVGSLISQYFAEERSRIRSLIETQLRAARDLASSHYHQVNIPQIGPATVSGTPSGAYTPSTPSQGGYTPSVSSEPARSGVVPTPSRPAESNPGQVPSESQDELSIQTEPNVSALRAPRAASSSVISYGSGPDVNAALEAASMPAPAPNRRWLWPVVGGVMAVLTGAGGGILALRGSDAGPPSTLQTAEPPASGAASTPSSETVGSSERPPAAQISVSITVTPNQARISIDGDPVPANPYEAQLPRDDLEHELRAEADGYETLTRAIDFGRDVSLELELRKLPARPGARTPRPWRPPPAKPPAAPKTAPTAEPDDDDWMKKRWPKADRPIDDDNPYGK